MGVKRLKSFLIENNNGTITGGVFWVIFPKKAGVGMKEYVYVVINPLFKGVKIGAATDVEKRISALNTSVPTDFELVRKYEVENCLMVEKALHKKLFNYRMEREFFDVPSYDIIDKAFSEITNKNFTKENKNIKKIKSTKEAVHYLVARRKYAGITQRELAPFCNLSHNGLSKIESGKNEPKISTLFRLTRFLGINIYFTTNDEEHINGKPSLVGEYKK